ncbi:MAG TPA: VOC family protein [Acidimicrobiales bacterium]|nr:VOC family protein [Acidimicrobiales bacterium]
MTTVPRPVLSHIALTVTDLDASIEWYSRVFDIKHLMDVPHEGGLGKLLADDSMSLIIVLHRHDVNGGELFSERATGLDHVGMNVATRDDLAAWQAHLEECGVVRSDAADKPTTQSPIADEFYGSVLVFRDPDNIQLELFCPAG